MEKSNNQIDDKINSFSLFVSFIICGRRWKIIYMLVVNWLFYGYAVVLFRMIMKMLPTRNKFHYEALSLAYQIIFNEYLRLLN